jgi:hypothetical protein
VSRKAEEVEIAGSYARVADRIVHLTVALPNAQELRDLPTEGMRLRLRRRDGGQKVGVPAHVTRRDDHSTVLTAEVPVGRLPDGVWMLRAIGTDRSRVVPLQARLLMSRTQPVALLAGPAPTTRMAPPAPRPSRGNLGRGYSGVSTRARGTVRRARQALRGLARR